MVADYPVSILVCLPRGIIPSWSEAQKKKALRRYRDMLWLHAERCQSGAEHEAGKWTTSWRDSERTCLVVEAWVGSSAGLCFNRQSAGPTSLTSRLVRTRFGRPDSRGAKLRGAASSARSSRLPSICHAATNRRPLPSRCCSGRRWRGKRTHSVEMPSEENRGVDSMGSDATLQTSERFEQTAKWQSP